MRLPHKPWEVPPLRPHRYQVFSDMQEVLKGYFS